MELIEDSDRIRVGLDVELDIKLGEDLKNFEGSCSVTCGLDFRADEHAFYLVEPVFEKLSIGGVPENYTGKVNDFSSKAASAYVAQYPVYTLRATDVKMAAAKSVLKGVNVKGGVIVVTVGL